MNEPKEIRVDKAEIIQQIAGLSRLLGMIPSDDTVVISEPGTHSSMELSKWLGDARNSFLRLSILIDRALDLNLQ